MTKNSLSPNHFLFNLFDYVEIRGDCQKNISILIYLLKNNIIIITFRIFETFDLLTTLDLFTTYL